MKKGSVLMVVLLSAVVLRADSERTLSETIDILTTKLVQEQCKNGDSDSYGSWPQEEWATGSIGLGLTCSYERTGSQDCRQSAILAGVHIFENYDYDFSGDTAYGLTRLQVITPEQLWAPTVRHFYDLIEYYGTADYIAQFSDYDPSMAIFYLTHHVLATHALEMSDQAVWREGLITTLSTVNNDDDFPVMALALATWALAETGPLNDTLIDPDASDASYWSHKTLKHLPRLLLDHQVPEGEPDAGSFYWRFDHLGGPKNAIVSGYTEDCIYAALGLVAVHAQYQDANESGVDTLLYEDPSISELEVAISQAEDVLINAVQSDGSVCAHVSLGGTKLYAFVGETLHAICILDEYEE